MSRPRTILLAGSIAVALLGAACSNTSSGSAPSTTAGALASTPGPSTSSGPETTAGPATTSAPTTTPTSTPTSAATATTAPGSGLISQPSDAGTWGTEPTVRVPGGPPPTQLAVADLIPGTGPEAVAGKKLTVKYVGALYSDGTVFDASWTDGNPSGFPFTLGAGAVIPGWDQGVAGMKVGGRRELVIPPGLAYGASGYPPTIPANATLIFIVDLLSVS